MTYHLKHYLLEQNKEQKQVDFEHAFAARYHQYPHGRKWVECPLVSGQGMEQLIKTSQQLYQLEPKASRFVSLGRTPIRMIQILGFLYPNTHIGYVAFSGRFINRDGKLIVDKIPDMTKTQAYREYLHQLALSPEQIIKNHSAEKLLVLVESVTTGGGLLSFLLVLRQWAREQGLDEQVRECIHLHVIRDKAFLGVSECQMPRGQIECSGFALKQQEIEANLLKYFFESAEVFNDSLGKPYPPEQWSMTNMPPAMGEDVSENADLLTFRIIDYLKTHNLLSTNTSSTRAVPTWRREPEEKSCCEQLFMLGKMLVNRLGF